MTLNARLRLRIVEMVRRSGEGHIPSSFSILDIIEYLYAKVLRLDPNDPNDPQRDYFYLSKGHGAAALFVVLREHRFLQESDLDAFSTARGILGGHPDRTTVPGVEASTGSLGHGFPTAVGTALGLRILGRDNRVFALLGDGECHEGTVWEAANVAANQKLGNLCAIVDWNGSAAQLMPKDDQPAKWHAFGWNVIEIDGHSAEDIDRAFSLLTFAASGVPTVVIAHTIKGKGVSFLEGHGQWHHRTPNDEEWRLIQEELT